MTPDELRERTRVFAVAVTAAVQRVAAEPLVGHAALQVVRAATSVAANYRAVCVARSRADFVSKMSVVVEEADEVVFWLEYLRDAAASVPPALPELLCEARHLVRIFAASRRTARSRK